MTMKTIKEIHDQIRALEEEKKAILKAQIDWDNLSQKELEHVFKQSDEYWNTWKKCPVGSLTNGRPSDFILDQLGHLTNNAVKENWERFIYLLRGIVKHRIKELNNG